MFPANKFAHSEGSLYCISLCSELRFVQSSGSQEHILKYSLSSSPQPPRFPHFLQHRQHIHKRLKLQSLLMLQNSTKLILRRGQVAACLPQPWKMSYFRTDPSIPLIFRNEVAPVQFSERSLHVGCSYKGAIGLEGSFVFGEQRLGIVGVVDS